MKINFENINGEKWQYEVQHIYRLRANSPYFDKLFEYQNNKNQTEIINCICNFEQAIVNRCLDVLQLNFMDEICTGRVFFEALNVELIPCFDFFCVSKRFIDEILAINYPCSFLCIKNRNSPNDYHRYSCVHVQCNQCGRKMFLTQQEFKDNDKIFSPIPKPICLTRRAHDHEIHLCAHGNHHMTVGCKSCKQTFEIEKTFFDDTIHIICSFFK